MRDVMWSAGHGFAASARKTVACGSGGYGFQNLRERYVVTLGEKIAQRIGLTGIECRGGNVKRPVLAQLEVGITSRAIIGCPILGGQCDVQPCQYGFGIGELCQTGALQ